MDHPLTPIVPPIVRSGPLRLRIGRTVGRTVYRQLGDDPSRDDELIGVMDTVELSRTVVRAVNAEHDGIARAQQSAEIRDFLARCRAGREGGPFDDDEQASTGDQSGPTQNAPADVAPDPTVEDADEDVWAADPQQVDELSREARTLLDKLRARPGVWLRVLVAASVFSSGGPTVTELRRSGHTVEVTDTPGTAPLLTNVWARVPADLPDPAPTQTAPGDHAALTKRIEQALRDARMVDADGDIYWPCGESRARPVRPEEAAPVIAAALADWRGGT